MLKVGNPTSLRRLFWPTAARPNSLTTPSPISWANCNRDNGASARAADELGKRGIEAAPAIDLLAEALDDRNSRVRASAALALGNLDAQKSVRALISALNDSDEDVRWSAAVALGRIKSPKAQAAFRRYTQTSVRSTP